LWVSLGWWGGWGWGGFGVGIDVCGGRVVLGVGGGGVGGVWGLFGVEFLGGFLFGGLGFVCVVCALGLWVGGVWGFWVFGEGSVGLLVCIELARGCVEGGGVGVWGWGGVLWVFLGVVGGWWGLCGLGVLCGGVVGCFGGRGGGGG